MPHHADHVGSTRQHELDRIYRIGERSALKRSTADDEEGINYLSVQGVNLWRETSMAVHVSRRRRNNRLAGGSSAAGQHAQ